MQKYIIQISTFVKHHTTWKYNIMYNTFELTPKSLIEVRGGWPIAMMVFVWLVLVEPLDLSSRNPWFFCCNAKEEIVLSSCVGVEFMNCHGASEDYIHEGFVSEKRNRWCCTWITFLEKWQKNMYKQASVTTTSWMFPSWPNGCECTSMFSIDCEPEPRWSTGSMGLKLGSFWLNDILASACSIAETNSACVPRRCEICSIWLQYCGHSITRSINCSNAVVPNINICNHHAIRCNGGEYIQLKENNHRQTFESMDLRRASRTPRRAIPSARWATSWCFMTEPISKQKNRISLLKQIMTSVRYSETW